MAYSEPQANDGRALLRIDAQIISDGDDFIIEITNSEKKRDY